jgi:sensor histidine kinase YesM
VTISGAAILAYFLSARLRVIRQKSENEKLELKNRLLFLEQRSLNASMNRHFIFNSLNSIQYYINSSDKLSANRFLTNFARLIRKNLDSSAANNFIVTLSEEIERIELYLSLERMRFSNKFDFSVNVASDLDTEDVEIPSMILQPFVENSIIHGVLPLNESRKGQVDVKIYREFGELVFEVTDNGTGIDNSLRGKSDMMDGDHESKGVEITNRRIEILRKLTGENLMIIGPFQMEDEEGNTLGTKVILKLGGIENE